MRSIARGVGLTAVAFAVSGCALPYYWQAAAGHLALLRGREPIETVLADPQRKPGVRETLELVVEMRRFAVEHLALPDNESYRSYVDLGRPYVVWNVVAAEEFAVEPARWCFPLLGCVSYRGYFDRADAERFAAKLENQGLDTYLAGANAYSTLGYFDDPVLNTMLAGGEHYVAGILFHELAHQKLYLKGDSDFNEAFATAVQQHGTAAWLSAHGSPETVEAFRRGLERQADFADLIAAQQARLRELYASELSDEAKRAAKRAAFESMRAEYEIFKAGWGGVSEYDAWFAQPLNNAQLASVATYRRWLPGLTWYLEREGLAAFYAQMQSLAELAEDRRATRLQGWLDAAAASGSRSGAERITRAGYPPP
jgi:predicted aminopeptidase